MQASWRFPLISSLSGCIAPELGACTQGRLCSEARGGAGSVLLAEDRGCGTGRGAVALSARGAAGSGRVGMSPVGPANPHAASPSHPCRLLLGRRHCSAFCVLGHFPNFLLGQSRVSRSPCPPTRRSVKGRVIQRFSPRRWLGRDPMLATGVVVWRRPQPLHKTGTRNAWGCYSAPILALP